MPRHGLASELFKLRIELGAINMNLSHIKRAIEMRALPSRMPCGARCKLTFFNQNDVRPAFKGKVIKQPHPHHATTNNHYFCMRFHKPLRDVPLELSSPVREVLSSKNHVASGELFDQLSGDNSQTYSMNLPEGVGGKVSSTV